MQPFALWLDRADPAARALVEPDGRCRSFAALRRMAGRTGLHVLTGTATDIMHGLVATALGGGTALPLPPGLNAGQLIQQAQRAAMPALALVIPTSGSSGEPKGVRLPWRAVAAACRMSAKALALHPGDAWLACLPPYHIGGAMILYRCLRAGATTVLHEGFDTTAIARDLSARRITHLSLVPPMLSQLLDAAVPPAPTLRCVLVGGAALSQALFDRAVAAGWPVCPTYGMTETCAQATVNLSPGTDWREGDAGRPLPGIRIMRRADGRLAIATPARMGGYLDESGRAPEWIVTSDLGRVDARGHVHVDGRADDMLISAGTNVHPREVESLLARCPGLREAAVAGVTDPVWGDVIACAYEGEPAAAQVEDWCRAHLPAARRPRRFLHVERLPRLASGKLDRHALLTLWGRS